MRKRIGIFLVCLMLVNSFQVIFTIETVRANGNTLYVGGSGFGNYTTIQSAVDAASFGDTIYIYNGIYYENVVVDKTINIIGEDITNTIIDGGGSLNVLHILSNDVNINHLSIQNGGYYPYAGIGLESSNNIIYRCNIFNNRFKGIVCKSNNNIIKDCNIYQNGGSIWLISASNCMITNCFFNPKYNSSIALWYSFDNLISYCDITDSNNGIYFYNSYGNDVFCCNFSFSGFHPGIYIDSGSNNNLIYHNNFYSTGGYDECDNNWDNGYPSAGNYWTNYSGADNYHGPNQDIPGSDGIGDTPYPIYGGINQDNYPLMEPYTSEPTFIDISIDIKPGRYPNSINVNSKGKVPVAILTNDTFDATTVNPETVEFLDASPVHYAMEDVDNDGDLDMILQFKTQQLNFSQLVDEGGEYPYAYLTGETITGEQIEGKDTARLVGPTSYTFIDWVTERFPILVKFFQHFPFLNKILNQLI